jgi:predicted  nucleic acid-binding Zn ribbon protein
MRDNAGMILAQVKFGRQRKSTKEQLADVAESYLSSLLKAGQICGEYLLAWTDGILNAHLLLAGSNAFRAKNHSRYGRIELAKVKEAFDKLPNWTVLDDDCPKRPLTWKDAPFLYLFTHAFDSAAPVSHGKSGTPIPLYTIPIPFEDKEHLFFWQQSYRRLDNIQLECGALEIAAYRQLADPKSELSKRGRDLCRRIEARTKVPTYYYLMRYWARPKGEEDRRCPGCGNVWKVERPKGLPKRFHHFDFCCDNCRLVSHFGDSTNGGHRVRIGEFQKKSISLHR